MVAFAAPDLLSCWTWINPKGSWLKGVSEQDQKELTVKVVCWLHSLQMRASPSLKGSSGQHIPMSASSREANGKNIFPWKGESIVPPNFSWGQWKEEITVVGQPWVLDIYSQSSFLIRFQGEKGFTRKQVPWKNHMILILIKKNWERNWLWFWPKRRIQKRVGDWIQCIDYGHIHKNEILTQPTQETNPLFVGTQPRKLVCYLCQTCRRQSIISSTNSGSQTIISATMNPKWPGLDY